MLEIKNLRVGSFLKAQSIRFQNLLQPLIEVLQRANPKITVPVILIIIFLFQLQQSLKTVRQNLHGLIAFSLTLLILAILLWFSLRAHHQQTIAETKNERARIIADLK